MVNQRSLIHCLAAVGALLLPAISQAAPLVFTVDASASSLSISPSTSLFGTPLEMQGQEAESLTTSYSGQIVADVTASTIQFLPTTVLVAGNSGNWAPGVDYSGYPDDLEDPDGYVMTNYPANYGISTDLSPLGTVLGQNGWSASAIRNLQISLSDTTSRPLVAGTFNEAGLATDFLSGTVYYASGGTPPVTDLANTVFPQNTVDVSGATGELITAGNLLTLTLPVDFNVTYNVNFLTLSTQYTGVIVATAIVPEPATGGLLGLAGLCLLCAAGRQHARRHA